MIAQIERDALDEVVPVATALRKCVVLGGKAGSDKLSDWALRELKGYDGDDDLPTYRVVPAPLKVDAFTGNAQITGQTYPASALPEVAREHIKEEVQLRGGIGGLEDLARQSTVHLMPGGATDIVRIMNAESGDPFQHIINLYWSVSPSAIRGVVDQVRTALTQLVAELLASAPQGDGLPSSDAADQAVRVVVTGRRSRVNVVSAQATDGSAATVSESKQDDGTPFWTRSRRIAAFAASIVTIAGFVLGVLPHLH